MLHDPRPVPEAIPGVLVWDTERLFHLKEHLANLCGLPEGARRFPGSQPVSFEQSSLALLENEDFWVCEKSDGVRVLVFVVSRIRMEDGQEVQEIDRKDQFYEVNGFFFPHWEDPRTGLKNTLFDGELVIDVDPQTQKPTLRLLAFDLLVIGDQNLMQMPLSRRFGRLQNWVIKPFHQCLRDFPQMASTLPFEIKVKTMHLAYGLTEVFQHEMPKLEHGNDGLIFTSAESPYTSGTDPKILKWKPPYENSIDFRLELRFPPKAGSEPREPDFSQKPAFLLMMNCGHREPEEFFDELYISDTDWKALRSAGEQLDDRIVEVVWDPETQCWNPLRFRDDKREGNFRDVVYSILQSIKDGVDQDALMAHEARIKQKWKERKERRERGGSAVPPAPVMASGRPPVTTGPGSLRR